MTGLSNSSSVSTVKSIGRSKVDLSKVLLGWVPYRIAWLLCAFYGGDWVAWNLLKSKFLEGASENNMHMINDRIFTHTLLTLIYDYGLVEADKYPEDPEAWKKCIEEHRQRAERYKRIKTKPEEYCRKKIRRIVNVKATPWLCRLLLNSPKKKPGIWLPPDLEAKLESIATITEAQEEASR